LQRSYEDAVSRSLLPVLGYDGGFSVTANVDLDPTSAETKTRRYDPEGQVVSSEELEETLTENNKPNGVPGVDANLPERPVTANSQTREEANQSRSNFMYPTVDELSRRPAGAIRHLSIAVQVDSARVAALATAHEIAPEEMQKRINDIVQAASGASDARGDVVEVAFLPFAATKWADGDAAAPALQPIEMLPYVPYAVAALAILLTFWFVVRPLMAAGLGTAAADEEEEDDADNVVELPGPEPLAARLREMVDNYEPIEATDLNNLIDEYPEATAQVLRKWSRA
jgi:flagellar biosynthesis/type III secretory pathway M-ring protein FliF/YscJ